jgi:RHS repeat-associated protein
MVRPQAAPPERTLYVHVDHLGSVEALTNEAGTVVEQRSYDAFGARRNPAWGAPPSASFPTTSSLGFTGHEDDIELGLVNMKGRLYDPHLSRFLTPDPVVAKPGFGQSWNPYSYGLNGPLSHVDPTGFTEEPADAVVSPGGFLIIPGPSDEPYVDMVWQVIAVGTDSEEPSEAPDSGAALVPQDANTWGNNAGWLPQPSATAQELPRQNSVGLEIYIGVTQGTAELAVDAAKSLVLNALTFGGYGTWQLGKAIWAGYHDGGAIGALNAVNPLYQLARGGADAYMAAEEGDYRAAGAAGVKTVVLGAAAVVGAARGAGVLAEGAVAGAARAAAVWRSVKIFQHTFKKHGQGAKVTGSLADTARSTGKPQGQWLDNQAAADLLQSHRAELVGPASIRIPDGLGQVIMPDGSIVNATRATLIPGPNGFKTAYPVP